MKILLLSNIESSHTIKWVNSLAEFGIKIFLLGFGDPKNNYGKKNIEIHPFPLEKRFQFIKSIFHAYKLTRKIKPDLIHSHYATSYGLIGALTGKKPFIISVWGSDIFEFPKKSIIHKLLLKFNLYNADKILSTSYIMAKETNLYTSKQIKVIPFGIDLISFKKQLSFPEFTNNIVIGTVKALEETYGIEYLIRAFYILQKKYHNLPLKLLIVGGGSQEKKLKLLTQELDLERKTIFTGKVPYHEIPKYHNMISISVSVSNSESFGVAILEASACETPVVVSNVGGLPEVVENGVTGIIVPPRDINETANAIERLILDKELRLQMGKAGRKRVKHLYNWNDNVQQMIKIYNEVIEKHQL